MGMKMRIGEATKTYVYRCKGDEDCAAAERGLISPATSRITNNQYTFALAVKAKPPETTVTLTYSLSHPGGMLVATKEESTALG